MCPFKELFFRNNIAMYDSTMPLLTPALTPKPKQVFFSSAKVLREFRGTFAEELCYFDGRSGLPTLCISAMILVALKNNSLIYVLCNRKYCLFVKLIFSVFIFP